MKIEDFDARISLFFETNPDLTQQDLAVLLMADAMYREIPEDLVEFRKKYAHLDPGMLTKSNEGITFLRIVREDAPSRVLKDQLNDYMNVKFHDIKRKNGYEKNAGFFKEKSMIASRVIEEILVKAAFPREIVAVLREREEVRTCYDFFEMLQLYKGARERRIHYEILRKIGLIVLIARINRTVEMEDLGLKEKQVYKAFDRCLRRTPSSDSTYYLWLNGDQQIDFSTDKEEAGERFRKSLEARRLQACRVHPLQRFRCRPFTTIAGNEILHMEIRNKFGLRGNPTYASYIEKMFRKNLEFPNQVHDTIGVKIVLEREDQIEPLIRELESFLGGSSTRKMEKNTYHRFGRRQLSEYSSPDYFVWKAVYDITLPHPSIPQIKKMLRLTRGNPPAQKELRSRLHYIAHHPRDFVIEVQLQDIKSYLLSIADGSPTAHRWLKMNQIRSNSFYKVFPKEIYEQDIRRLKLQMLARKSR